MEMSSRSAITKLQALLIIDLIIVVFAFGGYFYIGALAKTAEFEITSLAIVPEEIEVGESVAIWVNVTNTGDGAGSYPVDLTINGVVEETKTVELAGGSSTTVTFTVTKGELGSYSVDVDGLSGTFKITAPPPPPEHAEFKVTGLRISPDEAWVGELINISVLVWNIGEEAGSFSADLIIDNMVRQNKTIQVLGGERTRMEFTVTEESEGSYSVSIGSLSGKFEIVPTGKHTLSVGSTTISGVGFTINGTSYSTPYSELLDVGTFIISMPMEHETEYYWYEFGGWMGGSTSRTITITLTSHERLTAVYSGGSSSCPSLHIWNGTNYIYVSEVSNHGWLGYINHINEDGSIVFWRNDPWDYLKLDQVQLQPRNNEYYDLTLTQIWDEIFYLDAAYMLIVDHPSDVDVYSTAVEQYIDPDFMGQIYTVSNEPLTPISAVNEKGEDVLPQISTIDGIFTPGINGLNSPSWDNISWNKLTLNLGDLPNVDQIKLIVRGKVDWGSPEDYNSWIESFFAQPVPNGTQITPSPYMEVKDANRNWIRVPDSRQFPIPPDINPRTWVVDLTGLFPTNDYSLRINNFWNVTFDFIGVDTTSQTDTIIQRINPYSSLYPIFDPVSNSTGDFTRYGDVTQLLLNADDKFVIGRQGDEVSLKFPIENIEPTPENMERDIFLFVSCWFKDKYGNWGFGFGFSVEPLPFQDMSGFPYPSIENYPYDEDHLNYLLKYNTRTITNP